MNTLKNFLIVFGIAIAGIILVGTFILLVVLTKGIALLLFMGITILFAICAGAYELAKEMDLLK